MGQYFLNNSPRIWSYKVLPNSYPTDIGCGAKYTNLEHKQTILHGFKTQTWDLVPDESKSTRPSWIGLILGLQKKKKILKNGWAFIIILTNLDRSEIWFCKDVKNDLNFSKHFSARNHLPYANFSPTKAWRSSTNPFSCESWSEIPSNKGGEIFYWFTAGNC